MTMSQKRQPVRTVVNFNCVMGRRNIVSCVNWRPLSKRNEAAWFADAAIIAYKTMENLKNARNVVCWRHGRVKRLRRSMGCVFVLFVVFVKNVKSQKVEKLPQAVKAKRTKKQTRKMLRAKTSPKKLK